MGLGRLALLALWMVVAVPAPARSELSPETYAEMQREAPEELVLLVEEVSLERHGMWLTGSRDLVVKVEARVEAVIRSAAGLEVGDRLPLRYHHLPLDRAEAGPAPVPLLRATAAYRAFLASNRSEGFTPAARGQSFVELRPAEAGAPEAPEPPPDPLSLALMATLITASVAVIRRPRGGGSAQPVPAPPR